jgi:hypothetical protein
MNTSIESVDGLEHLEVLRDFENEGLEINDSYTLPQNFSSSSSQMVHIIAIDYYFCCVIYYLHSLLLLYFI